VPAAVKISLADSTIDVEGPKGKLTFAHRREISVKYDEAAKQIVVARPDDERLNRALHGLTRSLIANMVKGVTEGYTKKLEIVGVGYQAQLKKANTIALQVGFANQILMEAPAGVSVVVPDPTHITISGADSKRSASSPPRSGWCVRLSPTREKASATKVKSFDARAARRSERSKAQEGVEAKQGWLMVNG